jgi:protein-disulfide isomerase
VATKPKRPASYDLKAQDRKRNLAIQIGLTAIVVVFAVALVLYIVMSNDKKGGSANAEAVRITSDSLVTKDGGTEPKAVLSLYEDFQCPHCRDFEQSFGPTINKLIDSGAIAADYYMVAILDSSLNKNFSTRAANAGYCVADESKDAFRRFHTALFLRQPAEGTATAPDNAQLIEVARQAGAAGGVPDCVNNGLHTGMVQGLTESTGITSTPTVRINGEDYNPTTPDALVAKIKEIVGDVPGLDNAATPAAS